MCFNSKVSVTRQLCTVYYFLLLFHIFHIFPVLLSHAFHLALPFSPLISANLDLSRVSWALLISSWSGPDLTSFFHCFPYTLPRVVVFFFLLFFLKKERNKCMHWVLALLAGAAGRTTHPDGTDLLPGSLLDLTQGSFCVLLKIDLFYFIIFFYFFIYFYFLFIFFFIGRTVPTG